ncbi:cytochrome c [Roseimicrobium sp. ORNL1]|uniref:c-type cytochrome n=1 Tax=Roseimicrobium sp. ORNL1 TaxID=2711231 RepID=UPI0019821745|nr:cytochrome c [Roseimicrobium sp. ORNL1]
MSRGGDKAQRTRHKGWLLAVSCLVIASVACPDVQAHPVLAVPPDYPYVAGFDRFTAQEDDDAKVAEGGLLLLSELNCVSCHAPSTEWKERLPGRAKISLDGVGSRLGEDDIWLFIRSPQHRKKGTLMPGMFAGEDRDPKVVEALVSYLSSLKKEVKKFPKGDVERGRTLYHTVGCVACHDPAAVADYRPAEAPANLEVEEPGHPSYPILLADRYDVNALAAFLKDPLSIRKHGRMPSTELTDQEAADLSAYLHISREPLVVQERTLLAVPKQSVEEGKKQFIAQRCTACHETPSTAEAKPTEQAPGGKAMAELLAGQGCLSTKEKKAGVPDFGLSEFQVRALTLALKMVQASEKPAPQTVAQKSHDFLVRMDCYACHEWRGTGGLEEARSQYLTVYEAAAHSMGEIGRLPPKLDNAGRKLTKEWFEKLLWGSGGGVRGYMTARMPRFGQENTQAFIAGFQEACKAEKPVKMDTSGLAKHHRAENGRALIGVGKGGLGCVSCHGLKDRKSLGVPVVNLTQTARRLQPEYFKELLLNPQVTQPGTLMPPLFIGRKAADKEIEMLWTYLKEIDQSRLPEGLLQTGDYELKPEKAGKPIVFRTFLEGAGMHAVAVGFPQQMHVAFDSLEAHWAIAWKGRFVDAMTTWEERAMTPAKPLGEKVLTFQPRMPFAKLGSASDAWPEACGVAAGYESLGYRISKDGVPTFRYRVEGLIVEDTIQVSADKKSLRRTVTVRTWVPSDGWYFQGISKNAKPQPVIWKNGAATFEESIAP